MTTARLNLGTMAMLVAIGLAMFVLGPLWPKQAIVPHPVPSASVVASALPAVVRRAHVLRRRAVLSEMTYCPGPNCSVVLRARADCALRGGTFAVEPDFVCKLDDGVHRMVCDDIDDEHQCGMMSHSDLKYAQYELDKYWSTAKLLTDVDFAKDTREGKFRCTESEREIVCTFTQRSTGYEHPDSPIVCNWMGCGFPFAASAD